MVLQDHLFNQKSFFFFLNEREVDRVLHYDVCIIYHLLGVPVIMLHSVMWC
jgi:hypothetical protein